MAGMIENPVFRQTKKPIRSEFSLNTEVWKYFEDLASKDGCKTVEEFNTILAEGKILDALMRNGVKVTALIEGKEIDLESILEPILKRRREVPKPAAP